MKIIWQSDAGVFETFALSFIGTIKTTRQVLIKNLRNTRTVSRRDPCGEVFIYYLLPTLRRYERGPPGVLFCGCFLLFYSRRLCEWNSIQTTFSPLSSRCYSHRRLLVRVCVFSANEISNTRAINQGNERGTFIAAGRRCLISWLKG